MVFVLSASDKKLMPTTEYRARCLIKSGKAIICKYRPFTIKLTVREDGYEFVIRERSMSEGNNNIYCM